MLFIQNLNIIYDKSVRYPNYAQMRTSKKFDIISSDRSINLDCDVLFHIVSYYQTKDGFRIQQNRTYSYDEKFFFDPDKQPIIKNGLKVVKLDDGYQILLCNSNGLKKNVFKINQNEYGRYVFNRRYMRLYSGQWYYCIHTYNFINCDKSKFREKMFFNKNPNYEYSDLKVLI
jgi:hypothetical protein